MGSQNQKSRGTGESIRLGEGLNRVIQDVVRSSEISIWKAAGGVEEQMYSPRCLKNPFEKG